MTPPDAVPSGTHSADAAPTQAQRRRPLSPIDAALIAEACTRSDIVWVRPVAEARERLAWHVWHDDAVCVVSGAGEQVLPAMHGEVEVAVRSKETGARVVRFIAEAEAPAHGTPLWEETAKALAKARLNARDPASQRDRWAADGRITVLRPARVSAAGPGEDTAGSGAAPPPGGPGTTLDRRPFHLGGRRRRGLRRRRSSGGS